MATGDLQDILGLCVCMKNPGETEQKPEERLSSLEQYVLQVPLTRGAVLMLSVFALGQQLHNTYVLGMQNTGEASLDIMPYNVVGIFLPLLKMGAKIKLDFQM